MRYRMDRQMTKSVWIACLGMYVLGLTPGLSQAQMTANEFDALPDADKRTVLVSTLQEREGAVRNLQAASVTHVYNVQYRDGKTGPVVSDLSRYVCELRRKAGNHRASIDWFVLENDPDRPLVNVITMMDSKSGVARSVGEHRQMKGVYGAIATEGDTIIKGGRFHYWFDGTFDEAQEFPISFLLKQQEAIKFEGLDSDGQEVRISLDFEESNGTPYKDSRTVWIDPQRGFMPVRMHRRWEYATQPPLYTETDIDVKKTEQVDGVWFPTHFTETAIGRLSVAEGYATVNETTVDRITLGAVTDDDLQVHFADGVRVHDRINGVWFVANEATQSTPPPSKPGTSSTWLMLVNLVTVLAICATGALSRRRKKLKAALPG